MSRQVRRSLSHVVDEEADEQEPLLPKATIMHRGSVYSLMVFAPPLSRYNVGHFCSLPVLISCSLFVIALACQIGLTLIAGQYIRTANASFKMSLLGRGEGGTPPTAMLPADWALAKVQSAFASPHDVHKYLTGDSGKPEQCCNGAECAALHLRCCDRSNIEISSIKNESSASMLLVMQKIAVEESKPVYIPRSGNGLCYRHGGMLDCTPPSYLYLDAWDELDTNGDGTWTIEEATADQANLGCRFGVSVPEMFRSACSGIVKDAQDTATNSYSMPIVPTAIEKHEAISRDYFEWWKALVVICAAADMHRCSDLVQRGMFDGAIRMAKEAKFTRGGVGDLDTALDFCQRMLISNGICENALPGSYLMYRSRAHEKCGEPSYAPAGKYRNPFDERDVMTVTSVKYSMYQEYVQSASREFQCFLFLILVVWYVSLLSELNQIIALIDFTLNFKVNGSSPCLTPRMEAWVRQNMTGRLDFIGQALLPTSVEGSLKDDDVSFCATNQLPWEAASGTFGHAWKDLNRVVVIGSISESHRKLCYAMCTIRLCLWCYLANVGTQFVIYNRDYSELLMNAVALSFIFKLPEFLYELLVAHDVKNKLDGATTEAFTTSLPRAGWSSWAWSPRVWGLLFIPICAGTVVYYNFAFNTMPFLEALQCACYQTGDSCSAANRFQRSWWNDYWLRTTELAKHRSSWLQE